MIRRLLALPLLLACLAPSAAARAEDPELESVGEAAWTEADAAVEEDVGIDARGVPDPWEGLNRSVFAFNEFADRWFVEPLAIGWDTVVPEPAQLGVDNFFDNLALPRRIVNDLLQGKPAKAGDDFGRLLINTIFGIGGLFDVAGAEGFAPADEDFGQTLGVWGTPPGPYLVLPFFGPSNPRDTLGLVVESTALSPEYYFLPFYVSYISSGTRLLNDRSLALETLRAERAAAFDFYAAVRSAYVQYRANQVRDRADVPEGSDDDLYYFDEDEDFGSDDDGSSGDEDF